LSHVTFLFNGLAVSVVAFISRLMTIEKAVNEN